MTTNVQICKACGWYHIHYAIINKLGRCICDCCIMARRDKQRPEEITNLIREAMNKIKERR